MRRFSWPLARISGFALALLAPASLAPTPTSACSTPPLAAFGLATYKESIPSNGVLAGVLIDCPSCTPQDLQVFDASGFKVRGTFVDLPQPLRDQRWFAFRPETPWIEGARYQVEGPQVANAQPGRETRSSATFGVRPASDGEGQVSTKLQQVEIGVDPVGCVEWDPWFNVGCGLGGSFDARRMVKAQLIVEVSEVESSQYAYRIAWTRDAQAVEPDFSGPMWRSFAKSFDGVPSEVCFELFATPLAAAGVERSIAKECRRVDPGGLGPKDAPFDSRAGTLAQCLVPPPGYQAEWCKVLARTGAWCKEPHYPRGFPQSCQRAREQCPEDEAAGDAGADADASSFGSDAAADDESSAPQELDGGCSVRRPGANASLLALLGLLSLAYARRRARKTSP